MLLAALSAGTNLSHYVFVLPHPFTETEPLCIIHVLYHPHSLKHYVLFHIFQITHLSSLLLNQIDSLNLSDSSNLDVLYRDVDCG